MKAFKYLILLFNILGLAIPYTLASEVPIQYRVEGLSEPLKTIAETFFQHQSLQKHESVSCKTQEIQKKLQKLLEAHSYFKYHIYSQSYTTPNYHYITYIISPGPPLAITHINIQLLGEGQANTILQKKIQELTRQKGKHITTARYQSMKESLYASVLTEGFLEATWKTNTVAIDTQKYTATVTLILETGPRYTVGPIQFSEQPLKPSLIKQYLTFKEGDPYRLSELLKSQILLRESEYFKEVYIDSPFESSKSKVPIYLGLQSRPKYYALVGFRFIRGLGLQLKLEGLIRHLHDRGHQLKVIMQAAKTHFTGVGVYSIPSQSLHTQMHYLKLECIGHYTEDSMIATNQSYQWSKYFPTGNPRVTASYLCSKQYSDKKIIPCLSFHYETFDAPSSGSQYYTGLLFSTTFSLIQNNWFTNTQNYYLNMKVQFPIIPCIPFSTLKFLKFECEGVYCSPFFNRSHYTLLRGRIGTLLTHSVDKIPTSLRFQAGGNHYPRGYQSYLLSAHTIGGGVELRWHLFGLFYLNPFVEMNYDIYADEGNYKGSTGVGLCLWYPAIGHIEVGGLIRIKPEREQSWLGMTAKISTDLY